MSELEFFIDIILPGAS